ncbi:peptidase inhibitor family I36 protein [Catenuloplanes sp. NPDC051500]|uniref:peptidase inhibitor family I36 protein n=1 Tax=Catenuloplanes sp. NPDC051500 TaxID=3363959 RepID=UPI0037AFE6F6
MSLFGKVGPARLFVVGAATMLAFAFSGASAASAAVSEKSAPAAESAAVVAQSAPVTTLAAPANCGATYLCFWNNTNYSDGPGKVSGSNTNWGNFSHSSCPDGTWSDCASSIYNNGTSCVAHVYYYENYGAPVLNVSRGSGYASLGTISGYDWNNNIRSNNWC